MIHADFDTMQSMLVSYHNAMTTENVPDLTYVPKMYINKDYWVTKIVVPYSHRRVNIVNTFHIYIELDDRTDTDYWGSVFYDKESKTGIDFCVSQPEEVGDTPRLSLYPVVDGNIDTGKEFQIECEIINNF